jgi:hypothetical protein
LQYPLQHFLLARHGANNSTHDKVGVEAVVEDGLGIDGVGLGATATGLSAIGDGRGAVGIDRGPVGGDRERILELSVMVQYDASFGTVHIVQSFDPFAQE